MKTIQRYFDDIKSTLEQIPAEKIKEVVSILHRARVNRNQIFIMGNGGSAATASHFVCDLAKNTRKNGFPGFRVIGLTDNMAIFSAYANDEGYPNVFKQQLSNLMQPNDVIIAISCSGNSPNVLDAVEFANENGAITIGFTGLTGGKLKTMTDYGFYVPSNQIDQVEDIHLMLEHIICRSLLETEEIGEQQEAEIVQAEPLSAETDALVKELFSNSLSLSGSPEGVNGNGAHPNNSDLLEKISLELATKLDLQDLLSRILFVTVESVGAVGGSIAVLDEQGEVIDGALAYAGQIQEPEPEHLNETIHHGLAGWVLENRQPALVENTKEDPRWLPRGWEAALDLSRSAVSVPLMMQDRVFGVLTLTRMQSNRFTMEDLSLLTSITLALSYSFSAKAASPNKH